MTAFLAGAGAIGLQSLDTLTVSASTLEAREALAPSNVLQLCGLGLDGKIYHTIRFANGSWQSSYGDVNAQESNSGLRFRDADDGKVGNNLHVCGVGNDSKIYHTIRFANGSWQSSYGDVNAQQNNGNLRFRDVGCAGTPNGSLHVCGLGTDRVIYHTIRFSNGGWQGSFGNVNDQQSNRGLRFTDVDCATVNENLHVCAIGDDGQIYHTIRFSNGSWQGSFGNVNDQQSNRGLRFTSVGCAAIGGDVHVVARGRDGKIYHTIRFSNGSWQGSFGDVNGQESNSGLRFIDVDCGDVGNSLQVCGVGNDRRIYHTIRFANGSWQSSFGDVNGQESNSGLRFSKVGAAGV